MKRFFIVLVALMTAALSLCSVASGEDAGFVIPDALKAIEGQAANVKLPEDLPAEPAAITSVKLDGTNLSVELGGAVPALQIIQADDEGDTVLASGTDASSISTDAFNPETGSAMLEMTWQTSAGELVRRYYIWDDGTCDFAEGALTTASEDAGYAPYASGIRTIDFDEKMNVTGITWILGEPMAGYTMTCSYNEGGALADYACLWETSEPSARAFSVMLSADGTPVAVEYQDGENGCQAVSDPIAVYLSENSRILEAVGYSDAFIRNVSAQYSQIAEPMGEFPGEVSTMTDLAAGAPKGFLWAYRSGDEEAEVRVFATADTLFSLQDGRIVLNTEAKDLDGKAFDAADFSLELPAFELPVIK